MPGDATSAGPSRVAAAITIDLHEIDVPGEIVRAGRWLADLGVRASCFIPSAMLSAPALRAALLELGAMGHELGSHTHRHDNEEIAALMSGTRLGFLERSRDLHAEVFGALPRIFRSPRWCPLAPAAFAELARLGYRADSSATPQRLPWLSGFPRHWDWWRAGRSPRVVAPGLVEVPTSCALVPAGSPTFRTLRGLSHALLALLELEARIAAPRVVVVQIHVEDVLPDGRNHPAPPPLRWRDFQPASAAGLPFKLHLRKLDNRRAAAVHRSLVQRLLRLRLRTIGEIASEHLAAEATAAR